jgi:hypothetical protein
VPLPAAWLLLGNRNLSAEQNRVATRAGFAGYDEEEGKMNQFVVELRLLFEVM